MSNIYLFSSTKHESKNYLWKESSQDCTIERAMESWQTSASGLKSHQLHLLDILSFFLFNVYGFHYTPLLLFSTCISTNFSFLWTFGSIGFHDAWIDPIFIIVRFWYTALIRYIKLWHFIYSLNDDDLATIVFSLNIKGFFYDLSRDRPTILKEFYPNIFLLYLANISKGSNEWVTDLRGTDPWGYVEVPAREYVLQAKIIVVRRRGELQFRALVLLLAG